MILDSRGIFGPGLGKQSTAHPSASTPTVPPGVYTYWFDFTDLSTLYEDEAKSTPITADAETVAVITSKGADTMDCLQATADERPSWEATGINGVPAVIFGGSHALYNLAPSTVVEGSADMSWAVVLSKDTEGTAQALSWAAGFSSGMQTGSNADEFYTSGHNSEVVTMGSAAVSVETWGSVYHVVDAEGPVVQRIGTNLEADDTSTATGTAAFPNAGHDMALGANGITGTTGWVGHIGEIVIWPSALTAAEISDWEKYVTAKYGVVWA
jgi:hypothetical protein